MKDLIHQPVAAIERHQSEKLRLILALCARGHPYYRRLWSQAGIDIGRIETLGDLERLPLTPKTALMADPESFRLRLDDLPLQERTLWEIIYTTGSTAEPTPVYNTTHDYNAYLFQSQRVAAIYLQRGARSEKSGQCAPDQSEPHHQPEDSSDSLSLVNRFRFSIGTRLGQLHSSWFRPSTRRVASLP
jgi:phenylacetate-coenzyme A ligase PaaK-like adenylate-forming protein